jgi:hypothetical protein
MRRMHLIEIHDHPRFPGFLRDLVTDALQAMWDYGNVYQAIAPNLRSALEANQTGKVVDLCSGGGGPWLRLTREFEKQENLSLGVCLTDKYPNLEAFERARSSTHQKVAFCAQAIDATRVPTTLKGFRTMFSSFHHFAPEDARRVLVDAVSTGQGVGIFEAAKRCPRTMALIFWVPLMALGLTPLIRPFRWSRLFWTYIIPIVPFVLWFDGLVSCLRSYSQQELRELVEAVPGSRWEIGEVRTGLLPITYLIGFPKPTAPLN